MDKKVILGAGITGLAAGVNLGCPIYEAESFPGGICISYYIKPFKNDRLFFPPEDEDSYRFEFGGGHWIFGADQNILKFIESFSKVAKYDRKSSVFFPNMNLYVPYPLQNHLSYFPKNIIDSVLEDLNNKTIFEVNNLYDWLLANFGKTLCELFFFPFHELYTAGNYKYIMPQDQYKSPADKNLILKGIKEKTPSVGYNATFYYPIKGLNDLVYNMAFQNNIHFLKKVINIDTNKYQIFFNDGTAINYNKIYSTIPLNVMIDLCNIELNLKPDPYNSVLVLNIGGHRGENCPNDHWIYVPQSNSKFHRVGFYSNVDNSFLPKNVRGKGTHVSIYVERSFPGGYKITKEEIEIYKNNVIRELQNWEYIKEVEVLDATWIKYAYTWSWPGSQWRAAAIECLEKKNIFQIGRYGKWKFQGIAESIMDGLNIKK